MKPSFFVVVIFLLSLGFTSCTQQEDYKQVRAEVVAIHDKVMQDADMAYIQRKALDSVIHQMKPAEVLRVQAVLSEIDKANHEMEEWMEHFEPDVTGKSNEQSVSYFKAELGKVKNLDQHYKRAMTRADYYLDSLRLIK
ncbi:hypothetical protein [Pedobacter aquatilis]|uniref:hypothetical protein n=1 Tax=Pedobacter aquatilis TaxID=351343 RepID=UPI00292CADAC|nr:hypothetical protein [Pedobacter aquatilis]